MKKRTICSLLSIGIAAAYLALPASALATPITQTIDLGTVYTGTSPNGTAPWLVGTFAYNQGATTGTLTLQSNLSDGNFVKGQNTNAGWGFYLSGNTLNSLSCTSGTCAASTTNGSFGTTGPVPGGFDLGFVWGSNVFTGTVSAVYTLDFANALGSTSPFGPNGSGWTSVAHVQGITMSGCDTSGWIVDNGSGTGAGKKVCDGGVPPPTVSVPEPSALGILGLGILLLGGFLGLRRRYS